MNNLRSRCGLVLAAWFACGVPLASGSPAAAGDDAGVVGGSSVSALEDATFDRRVFRHVLVGKVRHPSQRVTWVLYRGATRAHLEIFCQVGQSHPALGITLNGKDHDESYWLPPASARFVGGVVAGHPLTYRMTAESVPSIDTTCGGWPSSFQLECRPEKVGVLSADAILIPGTKRPDDTKTPARWRPSSRQMVAALRCQIPGEGDVSAWRLYSIAHDSALVFAAAGESAPGVEWADENSDMVVQQGAYRLIRRP